MGSKPTIFAHDLQHTLNRPHHLIIRKAQHPQTEAFQISLPQRIVLGLFVVYGAIDLNHHADFRCVEIHNETINAVLVPELNVMDLPPSPVNFQLASFNL